MKGSGFIIFLTALAMITSLTNRLEATSTACTYVTDAGGYAYDECRAATNLAPAIALGTIVIVAIIAIAVQNSHDSSSHSHSGFSSSSGTSTATGT